ncbi:transmembrane protein 181-like [Corticium candelabrum]|uniref:transmembrane protein 181-like n=1 Tax=Corticium candelabrum TaxID=121492 RepID=UPI002E267FC7|nr:transmembrane protein 181-like [Corticium candelabrum]
MTEGSVQMRLHLMTKRHFLLVLLTFFGSFIAVVIVGTVGPTILKSQADSHPLGAHNSSQLDEQFSDFYSVGPFILYPPSLSKFNQQLWLLSQITNQKHVQGSSMKITMEVQVQLSTESSDKATPYGKQINHNRIVECKEVCDDLVIMHLGFISEQSYRVEVTFARLANREFFGNVTFKWTYYNAAFTQLEIWFRFGFLVLAFLATCLFVYSLKKFTFRNWSIEQKWMSILLLFLCLYNNPLLPLSFLVSSWIPGMLDALFQATFLSGLLLFWLCAYHGIRQSERRFFKFYLPKLMIVFLIWLSAVTLASWQKYNELEDPGYNADLDTKNFMGFKVTFFVVIGLYVLYLLYLVVRAFVEMINSSHFDIRFKFLSGLMFTVLAISIAITVLRFGNWSLQPTFISGLTTQYNNSAEFLAFYGLLNFYMLTMAFVYSPTKYALIDSHFQDDPMTSMISGSDDETSLKAWHAARESDSEG